MPPRHAYASQPGPKKRSAQQSRTATQSEVTPQQAFAAELAELLTPDPDGEATTPLVMELQTGGLALADVQASIGRYRYQEVLLEELQAGIPCIILNDDFPLPALILPLHLPVTTATIRYAEAALDDPAGAVGEQSQPVELRPQTEARGFLRRRLAAFLERRVVAQHNDGSGNGSPSSPGSPGLAFRVATKASGLRVHYSPAFFQDSLLFGNALTTPVDGWLQPGRYIFGAVGEGETSPRWERSAVARVPSDTIAHLMSI